MRRIMLIYTALLLLGCGGCDSGGSDSTEVLESHPPGWVASPRVPIQSEAVGRQLNLSVVKPAHGKPGKAPLLVFLHGAGGSSESFLGNQAFLTGLNRLGDEAPIVAFPEGEESWWHDRDSGNWGEYVVREVIPTVVRRFHADPHRVAIGGISMGGYGAYHLGLTYPKRFCAVGGHSAGLWLDPADEYPGAFDDQAGYEANDAIAAVRADPDAFGDVPVWNDYGDEDWFVPGNAAFVTTVESSTQTPLTAHVWPGGHDAAYWDTHWPQYLNFYAKSLASC